MNKKKILVVDDTVSTLEIVKRNLISNNYEVYTAQSVELALNILKKVKFDLIITDMKMPEISGIELIKYVKENFKFTEVIIITGYPTIETAVESVKLGANDYITKPFTDVELLSTVKKSLQKLEDKKKISESVENSCGEKFGIIGRSQSMKKVFFLIKKASQIDSTVLITGESGTGKELISRAIHYYGKRASAKFVPINCGAIPDSLLESELFGHVKGAFTGALTNREGHVKNADKGTIFLDEISETTASMQIKLLRFIQEKEFYMVGSKQAVKVDTRIIAATNKDLMKLVHNGSFREDLYYRLNVLHIQVPPLCERGDDILLLISYFVDKYCNKFNKPKPEFSEESLKIFKKYQWQGNVRELENTIHSIIALHDEKKIKPNMLPEYLKSSFNKSTDLLRTLEDVETDHIKKVLVYTKNNKSKAAKILGIDRKTLRKKLDE